MNVNKAVQGFLLSLVFFLLFAVWIGYGINVNTKNLTANLSGIPVIEISSFPQQKSQLEKLDLQAKAGILVFVGQDGNKKILFEKNSQEKLPIASLTKLMTALVVVENYNLSDKVTICQESADMEKGRPVCLLQEGQSFSVKSLLNIMLVESSSSAAYSLAEKIGQDKFVALMNKKAKEIGLNSVSFSTPVGRGQTNYLSAKEVSDLANYILLNKPEIFQMSAQKTYALYDFNNVFVRNTQNTDLLLSDSVLSQRIIGSKTGETVDAGQCVFLIVKANDNKNFLINVILNSPDRFGETKKIINWADNNFIWQENISQDDKSNLLFDPALLSWSEVAKSAPWEARDSHTVVVYKDKIWLMGGLDANSHLSQPGFADYNNSPHFSDVWSTENGKDWKLINNNAPWGKRRSVGLLAFNGKIWLMGGYSPDFGYRNDIWSTQDGINWKKELESAPWAAREGHQMVVFNNKMWITGGVRYNKNIAGASKDEAQLFNDVWYSSDGINWTQTTNNAAWFPRWDHTIAVFQNKLWLIGGMVFGSSTYNDIWYSSDGANWTQVSVSAPFLARQGAFSTEYKGKLWVIGRMDGKGNDIWYSGDGFNWEKTKNDPVWTGREDFGGAVFKDKIWIMGGMDNFWSWKNDIWVTN